MGSCPSTSKKDALSPDSSSGTNVGCCFCRSCRQKPVPVNDSPPDPITVPQATPVPSPEPPPSPSPIVVQRSLPRQRQRFKQLGFSNKKLHEVIRGYDEEEIVSLVEALAPFHDTIDGLQDMIDEAMKDCYLSGKDGLTHDESAAIYIYSMTNENGVYDLLHEQWQSLRKPVMRKWWKYLRLLKSAIDKLPSVDQLVWQVIPRDQIDTILQEQLVELYTGIANCLLLDGEENPLASLKGTDGNMAFTSYSAMDGKDITAYSKSYSDNISTTSKEVLIFPGVKLYVVDREQLDDGSICLHLKKKPDSVLVIPPPVTPVPEPEPPADVPCLPWRHSLPENDTPTASETSTPTPSERDTPIPKVCSTVTRASVPVKHFQCPRKGCRNACNADHPPSHCRGFSYVYHECAHHCSPKNRCFFCKKPVSKLHQCTTCSWRLCKQCCFQ